jgi:hypothetical protein
MKRLQRLLHWLGEQLDKGNPDSDNYRLPPWVLKAATRAAAGSA